MSGSLWLCGLQHTRLSCLSVCSYLCLLNGWCYLTVFLCHRLLLLPSIFPSIGVFSNESAFCIRWPKYCSFSFSNSSFNEYSGSISFQIDWFDFLAVHASLTPLALGCFVTQQWKPKKASQTPRVGGDGGPAFSSTVIVRLCTGQENSPFPYLE